MPGEESQPAVEPDVFDSPGHGLEADRLHRLLVQPIDARPDHLLAQTNPLTVGTHRERAHPPFTAREVHDVEAYQFTITVAPHHCPVSRVLQRIAPDQGIEVRHPDAEQPVPPIAIGEGLGEHPVQGFDIPDRRPFWSIEIAIKLPGHPTLPPARRVPVPLRAPNRTLPG